ncbi:MAG: ABC transporter ATP-binding protein/permease [Erysipelotrichia bacterium]|nr:ABC transporter ATP-binding protein/permease [Erysipelotrichia bacterium]
MLQLKNITKTYITGDLRQDALKDVTVSFRDCEFVSILGHSGSGKTTLLNIIGGLDQYSSGDLIINGVSTKKYKDRDWDTYRNHDIGFVFQSYNLIPHQTVLANVELALTLSGVNSAEREKRAVEALKKVGLQDHIYKKPNQLSGGQMQRVAIARALVNDPHILLADEPTGALDSETSVQIMNLLKEISQDKLVIMVTHNPDLAYQYSTRIIKLSDGRIIDDSQPYTETAVPESRAKKVKNSSMSFLTALSLSLDNLLTKKLRTFMTSFAGSIGIMGIALILSVSAGFQNYIDRIEENTLTSYPLTIYSETADATSAVLSMVSDNQHKENKGDIVEEKQYISKMFESIGKNDLKTFKLYLEEHQQELDEFCSSVVYKYSISPNIYGIDVTDKIVKLNPGSMYSMMGYSSSMGSSGTFNEMIDDYDLLNESYDILAGRWPQTYNEMIIVLSEPNGISDLLAYSLGLKDTAQLKEIMQKAALGEKISNSEPLSLTYEDLLNLEFRLINPTDLYRYNNTYAVYEDMSDDSAYLSQVYNNSEVLKIVGIVCLKDDNTSMALYPGVNYTKELTAHVMKMAEESEIVKKQLSDETVDVFSNQPFEKQQDNGINFNDMISVDSQMLNSAFSLNTDVSSINPDVIAQLVEKYGKKLSEGVITDTSLARNDLNELLLDLCIDSYKGYCDFRRDEQDKVLFDESSAQDYVNSYLESEQFKSKIETINNEYNSVQDIISDKYGELVRSFLLTTIHNLNFTVSQDYEVALSYGQSSAELFVSATMSDQQQNQEFDQFAQYLTACKIGATIENNSQDLSKQFTKDVVNIFGKDLIRVDSAKLAAAFKFNMTQQDLSRLMETMMTSSETKTAKNNLLSLGYQDEDEPTYISFYFQDFSSKQKLKDFIENYNQNQTEEKKISYTDMTGILMSSVETIINAVTYVLIAFVSISLVVSTIMIGVITLISVMERTKEIGILRAIGASKRDVGNVFNAETFIIGLLSGVIGIVGSELLLIPINKLLYHLTDIKDLKAVLPKESCLILILISVILTLISGLIPASNASKKNPVEALRTE